jgi:hypothetical protein
MNGWILYGCYCFLFLHLSGWLACFVLVCILLLWVVSDEINLREFPLHLIHEMLIRRSDRLMARFKQAAQEEAAAEARGRGCQFGRRCGQVAPAHAPTAGRWRGRGPTVGAVPRIFGLAHSEEEAEDEDVDEELDAEPAQQPPPPPPPLVKVMDRQTQLLQRLDRGSQVEEQRGPPSRPRPSATSKTPWKPTIG